MYFFAQFTAITQPADLNPVDVSGTRHHLLAAYEDQDDGMALLSSRKLRNNDRLQAAARNEPVMKSGESNYAVSLLQSALIELGFPMPISTAKQGSRADGIFGTETKNTVKKFQKIYGLTVDGIVGTQTLKILDRRIMQLDLLRIRRTNHCGLRRPRTNGMCYSGHYTGPAIPGTDQAHAVPATHRAVYMEGDGQQKPLFSDEDIEKFNEAMSKSTFGIRMRRLLSSERSDAETVFGNSLDFNRIFVSDSLNSLGYRMTDTFWMGIGKGRHVTYNVMLVGNLMKSPDYPAVFFHELTHCWQSQHHTNAIRYKQNSFANYGAHIITEWDKSAWKRAYDFTPGLAFEQYGSEQIAELVEASADPKLQSAKPHTFETAKAIVNHIRNAPKNMHDKLNELSLLNLG